jgi:hypothetical protein
MAKAMGFPQVKRVRISCWQQQAVERGWRQMMMMTMMMMTMMVMMMIMMMTALGNPSESLMTYLLIGGFRVRGGVMGLLFLTLNEASERVESSSGVTRLLPLGRSKKLLFRQGLLFCLTQNIRPQVARCG